MLNADSLALIEDHPTVQSINGHTRAHVLRVGPALYSAVQAWRHDPAASRRNLLREYAVSLGGRAYLALPIALPWAEANAFSKWLDGVLVCPATEEQNTALLQYLATVVLSGAPVGHFLGLTIDCQRRRVQWQSGAPYAWHRWQQPAEHLFRAHRGFPSFISNISYHYHAWWDSEWSPLFSTYLIIEWAAG
jgi:hypothetical protein